MAALQEGVKFLWQTSTTEFLGNEDGKVVGLRANTPEGVKEYAFDRIYLAVGSRPASRIVSTTEGIETDNPKAIREIRLEKKLLFLFTLIFIL